MGVTVFCTSKTLIRAALWQRTERDDFHFLNWWQQVVVMRLRTGHNLLNAHMFRKMKLAPSPAAVLKTTQPNMYCSNAHFCKQQDKMCGQQQYSYTPTHQLLRQQWGTGEDGHIQLAGWTLSVVAVDKKEQKKNKAPSCIHCTVWRAGLITECEGTYFAPFFFFPCCSGYWYYWHKLSQMCLVHMQFVLKTCPANFRMLTTASLPWWQNWSCDTTSTAFVCLLVRERGVCVWEREILHASIHALWDGCVDRIWDGMKT